MAEEPKSGFSIPPTVWVALLASLFGGFAARQLPFQDSRPAEIAAPVYSHVPPDAQDVEARLWEDPLSAVAAASSSPAHVSEEASTHRHTLKSLKAALTERPKREPILVLTALVSGAPYTEDVEVRRRTRYAVLAGLYQAGYVPNNSEHIGFVRLDGPKSERDQTPNLAAYEWFQRVSYPASSVLILWLDQDGLGQTPLHAVAAIVSKISDPPRTFRDSSSLPRISVVTLGPADSDGLQVMRDELRPTGAGNDWADVRGAPLRSIAIYSPRATAPDRALITNASAGQSGKAACENQVNSDPQELSDLFSNWSGGQIILHRGVTSDDRLACKLLAELESRGIKPWEIALIAERDTLYGRNMGQYFGAVLDEASPQTKLGAPLFFSYLRGLDGFLPPAAAVSGGEHSNAPTPASSSAPVALDSATGPGQLDYLRRLATYLAKGARDTADQPHTIKAVGVLGSDVYDKVMVLQALRTTLPRAIFFTTDLDARLLDGPNLQWTRQVLIASSLGLSLRPSLQAGVPPFRDTYQSATYFSVRLALNRFQRANGLADTASSAEFQSADSLEGLEWTVRPRIFEIGRRKLFDLTADPAQTQPCDLEHACYSIAAPPSQNWLSSSSPWHGTILGVVIVTLLFVMGWGAAGTVWWIDLLAVDVADSNGVRRWLGRVLVAGAAISIVGASVLLWPRIIDAITNGHKTYPASILGGASPWLASVFDVLTILAVIALVIRGQHQLNDNADAIQKSFALPSTRESLVAGRALRVRSASIRFRLMDSFLFSVTRVSADRQADAKLGRRSEIEELIARYLFRGTGAARLCRVMPSALLIALVVISIEQELQGLTLGDLFRLFTDKSNHSLLIVSSLSVLSLAAITFLIVWVTDAMLLSRGFILEVVHDQPAWPWTAIDKVKKETGLPAEHSALWLNLRLIATRTAWVSSMIWYPSIVLMVTVLATLTVEFGQYGFSNNPVAIGFSVSLVIGVAVALRAAAEQLRTAALEQLNDSCLNSLSRASGAGAPQTQALRQRVEALSEGAFAPFLQQPGVIAVLAPFLTYGITMSPQYLHIGT
jgi:hypothetical protein